MSDLLYSTGLGNEIIFKVANAPVKKVKIEYV